MNIDKLKQKNYDVKVRHVRLFPNVYYDDGKVQELDVYLTRGEFNKCKEKGYLKTCTGESPLSFGEEVSPTYGWTETTLIHPNKTEVKGKFNFGGKKKDFVRKIGVTASLGRCFKQFNTTYEDVVQ